MSSIFFENILLLQKLIREKKTGCIYLPSRKTVSYFNLYQGLTSTQSQKIIEENFDFWNEEHLVFEEKSLEKNYIMFFDFYSFFWSKSKDMYETTKDTFFEIYIQKIIHTTPYSIYKLGIKDPTELFDLFIIYNFFNKQDKTINDLLLTYRHKDLEKLKIGVFRLFILGQLFPLTSKKVSEVTSNPNQNALQKLLVKVASMKNNKNIL